MLSRARRYPYLDLIVGPLSEKFHVVRVSHGMSKLVVYLRHARSVFFLCSLLASSPKANPLSELGGGQNFGRNKGFLHGAEHE